MTAPSALERAHRRLVHLYEISKLFANFETVEQTFDPALGIAAKVLALRSAILVENEDGHSRMIVWAAEGESPEQVREAKAHVETTYAYLVGPASTDPIDRREEVGATPLPRQLATDVDPARRFIVIPLVVARQPPFGALQLEGASPFDKDDLMFINAIANQLAAAVERDRARRQELRRREQAEASSTKYQALADDNARMYDQAQHAVRLREQILAIVSHDLRNPLMAILTGVDLLSIGGRLEARDQQSVVRIRRAAQRIQRMIDDLLDFASIEAGNFAIKRTPQEPGAIICEALAGFEQVAQEEELQLVAQVEPHLPMLDCDRDRVLQVLSNLVGNATKVVPRGGKIIVCVEMRGHDFLFVVSDDGPGINQEDRAHLFERYWRGSDAQYKGTGLGLAIAKGIVAAHGGRIWVESEPGHGAKFRFTIPAARR